MAAHQMTPGQSQTLGCNFENWSLKKGKYQKRQDWGHSGPSGFFLGDVMDLSSSFFFRGWKSSLKKGAKKGASSFFIQMAHDPPFLRLPLKMRDPPFFPFFVDCVFRVYIYIYAVESITGPSLAVFKVNNWAKFVKNNSFCQKHYKHWGFRTFFLN